VAGKQAATKDRCWPLMNKKDHSSLQKGPVGRWRWFDLLLVGIVMTEACLRVSSGHTSALVHPAIMSEMGGSESISVADSPPTRLVPGSPSCSVSRSMPSRFPIANCVAHCETESENSKKNDDDGKHSTLPLQNITTSLELLASQK
jgi:hypothetical protein